MQTYNVYCFTVLQIICGADKLVLIRQIVSDSGSDRGLLRQLLVFLLCYYRSIKLYILDVDSLHKYTRSLKVFGDVEAFFQSFTILLTYLLIAELSKYLQ